MAESETREDFQTREIRGTTFEIGFISPVKVIEIGDRLRAGAGPSSVMNDVLSNTWITETGTNGEPKRWPVLKHVNTKLRGKPKTLADLIAEALKVNLDGFNDGPPAGKIEDEYGAEPAQGSEE